VARTLDFLEHVVKFWPSDDRIVESLGQRRSTVLGDGLAQRGTDTCGFCVCLAQLRGDTTQQRGIVLLQRELDASQSARSQTFAVRLESFGPSIHFRKHIRKWSVAEAYSAAMPMFARTSARNSSIEVSFLLRSTCQ